MTFNLFFEMPKRCYEFQFLFGDFRKKGGEKYPLYFKDNGGFDLWSGINLKQPVRHCIHVGYFWFAVTFAERLNVK